MIPYNTLVYYYLAHPDMHVVRKIVRTMRGWPDYAKGAAYSGEQFARDLGLSAIVSPETIVQLVELPACANVTAVDWLTTFLPYLTWCDDSSGGTFVGWGKPETELMGSAEELGGYVDMNNRGMIYPDWTVIIVTGEDVELIRFDGRSFEARMSYKRLESDYRISLILDALAKSEWGAPTKAPDMVNIHERPGPDCRKLVCVPVCLVRILNGDTFSAARAAA